MSEARGGCRPRPLGLLDCLMELVVVVVVVELLLLVQLLFLVRPWRSGHQQLRR